ncbi:MAG: radical SAM protein [Spirochaetes bacterium]|nr:radical SAM protein [Spirochaetota bacterium]
MGTAKMNIPEDIQKAINEESLSLEVTTRCTNACSHCFARAGLEKFPELDRESARSILCEGLNLGYRHLHITGGEPLLWPPLFEVLKEAQTMGYESIFMNTNGTLIDRQSAKRLSAISNITLSISLQGPPSINDSFRGSEAYQHSSRGIQTAIDEGLPVHIFCVTGKSLLPVLPHFIEETFSNYPQLIDITLIQLIRVQNDAYDISQELLKPDDFLSLVKTTAMLNLFGFPVTFLENPLATVAAHISGMPWLPPTPPLIRSGKLVILADKSITLAHSSRKSMGLYSPNILSHILSSNEYRHVVGENTQICSACSHVDACRKAGMLRPSEPFRDMMEDIPFCKRVLDLCV